MRSARDSLSLWVPQICIVPASLRERGSKLIINVLGEVLRKKRSHLRAGQSPHGLPLGKTDDRQLGGLFGG
jgi:hypothetical protein